MTRCAQERIATSRRVQFGTLSRVVGSIEIRYPDGSRVRKRFRRKREALRIWSAEQTKIENGTWHEQAPKTVAFETALKQYRQYSTVQNRSHVSYVEPALSVWEAHIKAGCLRRLRPL